MRFLIVVGILVIFRILDVLPFALSFVLAVTVHELGHLAAARLLKVKITSIKSDVLGVKIRYFENSSNIIKECIVCASGSILGLLSAGIITKSPLINYEISLRFVALSITLSIINLLPIRGLDGGAIISCILDRLILPDRSESIMSLISLSTSVMVWVVSVRIQLRSEINLSLLILSVYFLFMSIRKR